MPKSVTTAFATMLAASTFLTGCNWGGPNIEVLIQRGQRGASELVQGIPFVIVRSRDEQPVVVKKIVINDDNNCQTLLGMPMPSPLPVTLRLGQSTSTMSACDPIKVIVSTDRGDVTAKFR